MATDRSDTPMTVTGSTTIIGTATFTGSTTVVNTTTSPIPITTFLASSGSATIAVTTAGTSILVPSIATNAIYLAGLNFSNGAAQGSALAGYGTGVVAPTTSAILVQSIFMGANVTPPQLIFNPPIRIPASNNVLITATSCTTLSITAIYYAAP